MYRRGPIGRVLAQTTVSLGRGSGTGTGVGGGAISASAITRLNGPRLKPRLSIRCRIDRSRRGDEDRAEAQARRDGDFFIGGSTARPAAARGRPSRTSRVHWHNTQRLHGYLGDIPAHRVRGGLLRPRTRQRAARLSSEEKGQSLHQTPGDSNMSRSTRLWPTSMPSARRSSARKRRAP